MKLILAGGGTGGHIYIAISLARALKARRPGSDCLFIGTRRGLESRIVPKEGFRLEFIHSEGLKRVGMRKLLHGLSILPRSLLQARRLVREYGADVVVGVGGYSSGPVVAAAWWQGVPTLIVEPNAVPGLTNRLLARIADRATVALPDRRGYFRGKATVTGIPVREEFRDLSGHPRRAGELTVLVYGGSQGSHALNLAVCHALRRLKETVPGLHWIHQTGEKDLEMVKRTYEEHGVRADVRPFLPKLYEEMAASDLILSRAGAGTVAELTVAGKASILIPFPGAADDHQTLNARALEESGAARVIPERDLGTERLVREIRRLAEHPEELKRMEQSARSLGRPDAAERIVDVILELAEPLR